jgi:acyl carrier protein
LKGKKEMFEEVKEVIVDTLSCEADKVTLEANIFDDLGADSLDAVELNLALEERFDVTIDEEVMAQIKTVGDIVEYLEAHK